MDICLCASTECPYHKFCLRGTEYSRPASPGERKIMTVSYLADICNRETGFSEYIKDTKGAIYNE